MISNLTQTAQYNRKVRRNGYTSTPFLHVPFLIKTLILAWIVVFSPYAEAANSCAPDKIQARLDAGQSAYSVLRDCPALALEDFYGKTFAGGVIVYLDSSRNGEGIVTASNDASSNATWSSMWLGTSYLSDLLSSGIGSGKSNTARFCQSQGTPNNNSICGPSPKQRWQSTGPFLYGFEFASKYQNDTYSDWYLPSSEELTTARNNSPATFSSCPTGGWWTSTQVPQDYDLNRQPGISESSIRGENVAGAFAMDASGNLSVVQKMEGRCIRPFRSFSPWVDSINPTEQATGLNITIHGSNFDSSGANNIVKFSGGATSTASSVSSDGTTLTVPVPDGAQNGVLSVDSGPKGLFIQSNATVSFTLAVPKPTISRVITAEGPSATTAVAHIYFTPAISNSPGKVVYKVTGTPGNLLGACDANGHCVTDGLTFGTAYIFVVSARDAQSGILPSNPSRSVKPLANPRPPQNFKASAAYANNASQISVSFSKSASDGGSAITGYSVNIKTLGSTTSKNYPCNNLSCTISENIAAGKSYVLWASATNVQGQGATTFTTVKTVAPPTVTGVVAGPIAGNASVSFTESSSSNVKNYTATAIPASSALALTSNSSGSCNASPCTVSGLASNIVYNFAVAANSKDGSSTASSPATVQATGGAAPSPSNVSISAVVPDKVSVSFTPPAGSGYKYTITNNVDAAWKQECSASPCKVTPTRSGDYTYSVTTSDQGKGQISPAVASNNKARVFFAPADTSWAIPQGVSSITALVTGAGGGGGGNVQNQTAGGDGGDGANAKATLSVTQIKSMDVIAGSAGAGAKNNPSAGGGGGGASAIRVDTTTLIAGGGGGGGGQLYSIGALPSLKGGNGGNAGLSNGTGNDGTGNSYGRGGSNGTGGMGSACSQTFAGSGKGGSGGKGSGISTGGSGVWADAGATNGGNADSPTICPNLKNSKAYNSAGGAGGGGYGGGGGGGFYPFGGVHGGGGGGGGGSMGPSGAEWTSANNGGAPGRKGGNGKVLLFY